MNEQKIIKRETTPNFKVAHYKNPPKKKIKKEEGGKLKYRTKEVIDKEGKRHLVRFVVMKKKGVRGGTTKMTSIMHPKDESTVVSISKTYINEFMSR